MHAASLCRSAAFDSMLCPHEMAVNGGERPADCATRVSDGRTRFWCGAKRRIVVHRPPPEALPTVRMRAGRTD